MSGASSEAEPIRRFTSSELRKLDKPHNAHIAVRGKVYDVSKFVARHPGGMEQIMMGVGRDVTAVFESYHSFDVYKVLEKFYVGELVDNEFPVFPEPSNFHRTLKQKVHNFFKENNIDPKVDYWMFLRIVIFCLLALFSWLCMLYFHANLILSVPASVTGAIFTTMVQVTIGHDSTHFAITHKPWVWKLFGSVSNFSTGSSSYIWIYQHVFGHHSYTNIDEADPDIHTVVDSDAPSIRRIKWKQKWLPRYFNQHVYIPILYCMGALRVRLQDFKSMYELKTGNIRMNRPNWNQVLIFFGGKLTFITYTIIIPLLFVPWTRLLLLYIIFEAVFSWYLFLLFQVSHVVDVKWPTPDEDNKIHMDWAEMQVETTLDYSTNSWFWTVFSGALNHQTAHHIFPGFIESHYPKITPIVQETCKEFGIKYNYVDTASEAIACHINYLKKLGQVKEQ